MSVFHIDYCFPGVILMFDYLQQGCTLKEAAIVASILSRTKLPVLHASAALIRIAEMDYSGECLNHTFS
jgi:hypothetical protein